MKKILSINKLAFSGRRFDIEVQDTHNYFADGINVHNCCLPTQSKLLQFDWKRGVFSQLKADGMFVNINHNVDGSVDLISRSGSVFPIEMFNDVVNAVTATFPKNTQTHGELLIKNAEGVILPREVGNGLLNSVLKGADQFPTNHIPVILVWDQIPLDAAEPGNKYHVGYERRFDDLEHQILATPSDIITLIPTKRVHSMDDALVHYSEMVASGLEGTIIKDPCASWEDTTSKRQVKLKLEVDVDLEIVGFTDGNGKNATTFGSIIAQSSDGLLVVNVSGFKDKKQAGIPTRAEIAAMKSDLIGTIMTIKANNIMVPTVHNTKYSLFLPRFCEFRKDKTKADSLQDITNSFKNAVTPK